MDVIEANKSCFKDRDGRMREQKGRSVNTSQEGAQGKGAWEIILRRSERVL